MTDATQPPIRFNPDGTITLRIAGDDVTLGPITLRQYAAIIDEANRVADDARARAQSIRDMAAKVNDESLSDATRTKWRTQLADATNASLAMVKRVNLELARSTIDIASARWVDGAWVDGIDIGDVDDLPLWMADRGFVDRLLRHWEAAPFGGPAGAGAPPGGAVANTNG